MTGHKEQGLGGNGVANAEQYTEDEFLSEFRGPIGSRILDCAHLTVNLQRRDAMLDPLPAIPHLRVLYNEGDNFKKDLTNFLEKMPDEFLLMATYFEGMSARLDSQTGEVEIGKMIKLTTDSPELDSLLAEAERSKDAVARAELAEAIRVSMHVDEELERQERGLAEKRQKIRSFIELHRDNIPEITE
jgi:hypothetical protein